MQDLINLKVLLGDASVLPPGRQSQVHQVQQQLGLVPHLVGLWWVQLHAQLQVLAMFQSIVPGGTSDE